MPTVATWRDAVRGRPAINLGGGTSHALAKQTTNIIMCRVDAPLVITP
jgi:hypothetical protein